IKKIYNNIQVAYEDFKNDVNGKIVMISDTDAQIVSYPTRNDLKHLICQRIYNDEKTRKTTFERMDSNKVSPKTEIEDALNGLQFYETLVEFKDEHPEIEQVLKGVENPSEEAAYFSLDLSLSKRQILDKFFNTGNTKLEFAKKYSEQISDKFTVPEWIEDLKKLF